MKKKKNYLIRAVAIAGLMLLMIPDPVRAQVQAQGVKRIELQRYDLSCPGREVIQSRIDFTPGSSFGNHRHPGEEIIYVIEGLLEYKVEGKPPVTLRKGEVLFIPAGTVHAAKNVGKGTGAELATYIVEKGKPLLELVEK